MCEAWACLCRILNSGNGHFVPRVFQERILTLHPFEGTVGKLDIFLEEPSSHPIDSVGGGSVRKPVTPCVNAGAGRLERWRCSMRRTLRRKRQSGRGSGCITWGQS